jgi:hypothetical protein
MSSLILGVDCWKRGVAKGKEEEGSCADREPENGFLLPEGLSTDFVVEEEDGGRKRLPGAGVYDLLTHLLDLPSWKEYMFRPCHSLLTSVHEITLEKPRADCPA